VFSSVPSFNTTAPVVPTTCAPIITDPNAWELPEIIVIDRIGANAMVEVVLERHAIENDIYNWYTSLKVQGR
jgi:hypothetical protein